METKRKPNPSVRACPKLGYDFVLSTSYLKGPRVYDVWGVVFASCTFPKWSALDMPFCL